jgi:hypothetical protein
VRRQSVGQCRAYLRQSYGWEVVVPTELPALHKKDEPCLDAGSVTVMVHSDPTGHTYGCCMRKDIAAMLLCHGAVFMPGWQRSRGASLEHMVALQCGLPDMYYQESRNGIARVVNGAGEAVPSSRRAPYRWNRSHA